MNKVLTEAVVSHYKKSIQLKQILKEAMQHPAFNKARRFENEIEMQLHETFGSPPGLRGVGVGRGGSGMYGEHTEAINALQRALTSANMNDFQLLNSVATGIAGVMATVDPVIALLNSDTPSVKQIANVLVGKVFTYLDKMFDTVTKAATELKGKLPSGFDRSTVEAALRDAAQTKRESEKDLKESSRKIRRIFGHQNLNEGLMSNLLNPGNGKLDKYTSKVDAFIDEAIETCDDLVEEGNGLLEEDFYRLPQAGERSRLILEMIGLIKKFKCDLENIPWQLRQRMG